MVRSKYKMPKLLNITKGCFPHGNKIHIMAIKWFVSGKKNICSKIMLLSAHARAWENRCPLQLTVATSINNNKYMYIQKARKHISSIKYIIIYKNKYMCVYLIIVFKFRG